jgi:nicotinamidase/pyrazinamidase
MRKKDALIIVDVQNDFCPGGALGVEDGDKIVPILNGYMNRFAAAGLPIVVTRDWHPRQTSHFKDYGGVWPVHCVQNTSGAEFHRELKLPPNSILVSKGAGADEDAYSAFQATDDRGAPLAELLRGLAVGRIFVGGLATDYCVKHTALDGLREGFAVVVLADAIRGVDLKPGDSTRALSEMRAAGVSTVASIGALAI